MSAPLHADFREITQHMRNFGLMSLGRAVYEVTFSEMMRPYAHPLAVGIAAHGAELVLKSRIAEKDPLLIFKKFPKSLDVDSKLSVEDIFEYGRTIQFSDIPDTLLAVTGVEMTHIEMFQRFGRIRNKILHLGAPDADHSSLTLKFVFEVMEPLVIDFWNESIVPYTEDYDDSIVSEGYLEGALNNCGIDISPKLRAMLDRTN